MTDSIRVYQITDKAACLGIFDSNTPDFFDRSERDLLSDFLDSPIGAYFVVERVGVVIGSGGYGKQDGRQAGFTWGMVHRRHHGEGLGQLLAEYRLSSIEKSGEYSEIEIHTTPKVAPFFEKFGFESRKVKPDGFAPGMDQVQMIKQL